MLERIKNTGTILAITSAIMMVCTIWGILDDVMSEKIIQTVQALCTIGVFLGILNNPTKPGLDNPFALDKDNE